MNSNDLQNLSEAYNQIQRLSEAELTGGYLGVELRPGYKGLKADVNTNKGSATFKLGRQQVGNGPTDPKDSIDAALGELGDAAYGGKPGAPQQAAKPTKPKTITTGSVTGQFADSIGPGTPTPKPAPAAKPAATKPDPTKTKPVIPVKGDGKKPVPTDGGRPVPKLEPPKERVQNPSIEFSHKPEPPKERVQNPSIEFSHKPEPPKDLGRGRDNMRMDTTSDLDIYNLVLEYLLDEGFASTEQSADKIILNMSEAWFENIMERRREDKGTPRKPRNKAFELVAKSMGSGRLGVQPRGEKKDRGGPTPGPTRTPAEKVAKRRADAERAQDMMHSARD